MLLGDHCVGVGTDMTITGFRYEDGNKNWLKDCTSLECTTGWLVIGPEIA